MSGIEPDDYKAALTQKASQQYLSGKSYFCRRAVYLR